MKGYILAFNTRDKNYRIPNDILMKNANKLDPRTAEEIKRILKERKEEKEKMNKEKERLEKLNYYEQKKKLAHINQKINQEKERTVIGKESNYATIKRKHEIFEKEKEVKLTWDQLENMNSNFFNSNRVDDFNPQDLIEEEDYDSDDDLFLNLYNKNKLGNKKVENLTPNNNINNNSNGNLSNLSSRNNTKKDISNRNNIVNNSINKIPKLDKSVSSSTEKLDKSVDKSLNKSIGNVKKKFITFP